MFILIPLFVFLTIAVTCFAMLFKKPEIYHHYSLQVPGLISSFFVGFLLAELFTGA